MTKEFEPEQNRFNLGGEDFVAANETMRLLTIATAAGGLTAGRELDVPNAFDLERLSSTDIHDRGWLFFAGHEITGQDVIDKIRGAYIDEKLTPGDISELRWLRLADTSWNNVAEVLLRT